VSLRQLPNAITAMRMLLVVPLAWSLQDLHFRTALAIALFAGASDALDGWLAKRYGWQSWLGGLLDPVADKLFIAGSFVGLWLAETVPGWFVLLVIGRDLVIIAGAVVYNAVIGPVEGDPTLVSKATMVAQITMVLLLLIGKALWPLPPGEALAMLVIVGVLTFASGIDYVIRWGRRAWKEVRARRKSAER
jgi:cardiolipin synthase